MEQLGTDWQRWRLVAGTALLTAGLAGGGFYAFAAYHGSASSSVVTAQPVASAMSTGKAAPPTSRSVTSVAPAAQVVTGTVNINTADASELTALPGIGTVKAQAIVAYRQTHGPFRSVDDLDHVKGIGPATVARLRPKASI